ncbi:MAG TPA: sugar phosphate isomerase/epimerase family protein [Atribacteraceae bacterium]|nr:sugar phosphate isomerase/epimerase family protein [Atribacteraceae bacterium]
MAFKVSVGLWCLGGAGDRYNRDGYSPSLGTGETIALASRLPEVGAVEIVYPTGFRASAGGGGEVQGRLAREALDQYGLQVSSVLVNTFTDPKWQLGSLGAGDPAIRSQAVGLCKEAVGFARAVGSPAISLWLGQDGFDYPFQIDYQTHWDDLRKAVVQVADLDPTMLVSLEYKHREPRNRMTLSGAAKVLLFVNEVNRNNVGVCMDFGHALACKESAAESVVLLHGRGKLFNVHINDCLRDWDDDMIVGSVHLPETLEFLYYLEKTGYDGWLGLDQFPYREDAFLACKQSIENIRALERILAGMDKAALRQAQGTMSALDTQNLVRQALLH